MEILVILVLSILAYFFVQALRVRAYKQALADVMSAVPERERQALLDRVEQVVDARRQNKS